MHELSLCRAVVDTVNAHAHGRPVHSVRLRIGHFRQAVPESMVFCWEMTTQGTPLEGCRLDVVPVAAVVVCADCTASTELTVPVLRCGSCSSQAVTLVSGEEFLVESIDVGAAPTTAQGGR